MSGLALLALQAALVATNYAADVPMAPPASRSGWADEFDGGVLDTRRWEYDTARNKAGWYNGELQYYSAGRPANVRVAGGLLTITAQREDLPGTPDTQWPADGEIDIMEQVGAQPKIVHATLHTALFNHARHTRRGAERTVQTSCTAFHRYQLDWRPDAITIGVDGRGYMRVANDRPGGRGAWPFDAAFRMILNLALGGGWAGAPDDAALPQSMQVDYVRVWPTRVPERR